MVWPMLSGALTRNMHVVYPQYLKLNCIINASVCRNSNDSKGICVQIDFWLSTPLLKMLALVYPSVAKAQSCKTNKKSIFCYRICLQERLLTNSLCKLCVSAWPDYMLSLILGIMGNNLPLIYTSS